MVDPDVIEKEAEKVLSQFFKGKKLEKMKKELAKTMSSIKKGKLPDEEKQ